MFLSPTAAEVTYADKIVASPTIVVVSRHVDALYFGTLWFPYDRALPVNSSRRLCVPGAVVPDWSVGETPIYACCATASNRTTCPVPPPPTADILRALLFERPVDVWWQNGTDAWQRMDAPFVYYDAVSTLGLLKRCIAVAVVLGIVLTVISTTVGGLHRVSSRYPRLAMGVHVVVLVVVSAFSVQILVDFKDPLTRFAAMHMLLEAIASPLVVYTPEKEQRIQLRRESARCCRRRRSKQVVVWAYSARMLLCTPVAVLGMCEAAWEAFDAEFDLLIALAMCVVLMTAVHTVAFVTGVHGVEIPLRLNDHAVAHAEEGGVTVVVGSFPVAVHGKGWMPREWKPTPCRVYGASVLRGGSNGAIVLWDFGSLRYGKVRMEHVVVSKLVYVANRFGDLEKIGETSAEGVLRRDNDVSVISRVLGFLLWVHPRDDDEGNLNMVHNLRSESHRLQRQCRNQCCRLKCGVVWWCAAGLCVGAHIALLCVVWDSGLWWLMLVETVGLAVTLDFGVLAATRVAPTKMRGAAMCPAHHSTTTAVVDSSNEDNEGWTCDACQRKLALGERVSYCETCDWAQCEVCGVCGMV